MSQHTLPLQVVNLSEGCSREGVVLLKIVYTFALLIGLLNKSIKDGSGEGSKF